MILALDVGNTNIKTGLFGGGGLLHSWRLASDKFKTSDEYGIFMESCFKHLGESTGAVEGIIMSSVIPSMNYTLEHMCRSYFNMAPMLVTPAMKMNVTLNYEDPYLLGTDRICNAVSAYENYGGPVIVVDFGTATTYGVVNRDGVFLGGAISPGLRVSTEALVEHTSRLPMVELVLPEKVIGTNTVHALQSGFVYGYIGQVDFIVNRMKNEMEEPGTKVVATGGLARLVASASGTIREIRPTLTLEGLYHLYKCNRA